jgi:hypothetical protein
MKKNTYFSFVKTWKGKIEWNNNLKVEETPLGKGKGVGEDEREERATENRREDGHNQRTTHVCMEMPQWNSLICTLICATKYNKKDRNCLLIHR